MTIAHVTLVRYGHGEAWLTGRGTVILLGFLVLAWAAAIFAIWAWREGKR